MCCIRQVVTLSMLLARVVGLDSDVAFQIQKLVIYSQKFCEVFMMRRALVLIFFSLVLAIPASAQRWPNVRANLHTHPFGKLTQFWAHQAAGIPEGHAFIRELEQNNFAFATPQIGVLDTGFVLASMLADVKLAPQLHKHLSDTEADPDERNTFAKTFPHPLRDFLLYHYARREAKDSRDRHGSAVAYLLASNTHAGTSLKGEIAMLLPFPRKFSHHAKELHEMIAELLLPQVVNYSMSFGNDDHWSTGVAAAAKSIAATTIVVTSAGNHAPDPIELGKRELAEQLVIVGSADPTGHVSSFSQTGCAETIRTCSDSYIQSISPKSGEFFNFGGTSGAAPLVSGALADGMSILPDLSREHAVLLLKKTALANADGDAVGLLNYYKLLRVAHRLAERGWVSAADEEEVLHDPSLYDFHAESEQLTQAAIASPSNAFLKLRQAFLLDHTNNTTRTLLAEMYRQHGYEAQAFFYDNPNTDARNAFIAQKDKGQHAIADKFFAAIAIADTQAMLELLPDLNPKIFLQKKIRTLHNNLRALAREKQMLVINFLQEHRIAIVTISDDGEEVTVRPIRDRD